ncbi:hypothetical protein [Enterobacter roggenkampii]|uniref:hypothetical protein n=1 Tax=Enterobacter roggenkampii TaxID=1812935 RepID=UPI0018C2FE29|nr:hypothetical protein [Enterobacter roggenkampii]MBG0697292.1 hypothetical protein [Enterobacter roggenkampii]MCO4146510.1 hypothetical protein [Enterobacter roggenkampii]
MFDFYIDILGERCKIMYGPDSTAKGNKKWSAYGSFNGVEYFGKGNSPDEAKRDWEYSVMSRND